MKSLFYVAMLFCTLNLPAQTSINKSIGDTLGPWTTIDFEEPSPYIINSASMQNLWQIGPPQKTIFNQAYTPDNAIVTELMSYYMVNNHSWFDLIIGGFNTNQMYFYNLFVDFMHKINSDTLHDGGYITISWDNGQTFMNILDDTVGSMAYYITPSTLPFNWGNTNLYTSTDTLYNGEKGFSGSSNGWIRSCIAWYNIPVKKTVIFPPDTVIIRFNFISDNIHHDREGWMIDHIRIYSIDLGTGIADGGNQLIKLTISPNPATESACVTLDHTYTGLAYLIYDFTGRIIKTGSPGECRKFNIPRNSILPGVYFLKVVSVNSQPTMQQIIFL